MKGACFKCLPGGPQRQTYTLSKRALVPHPRVCMSDLGFNWSSRHVKFFAGIVFSILNPLSRTDSLNEASQRNFTRQSVLNLPFDPAVTDALSSRKNSVKEQIFRTCDVTETGCVIWPVRCSEDKGYCPCPCSARSVCTESILSAAESVLFHSLLRF